MHDEGLKSICFLAVSVHLLYSQTVPGPSLAAAGNPCICGVQQVLMSVDVIKRTYFTCCIHA